MKAVVKESGVVIAQEIEEARSFFSRLLGLMFRPSMKPGSGLLLSPCNSVHTCFMRFKMDGVFVDKDGQVLYVVENMKPWRMTRVIWGAQTMLELPGGTLAGRVQAGQHIVFEN